LISVRVNALDPGPTRSGVRIRAYPGELPSENPDPALRMPGYLYLLGSDSRGITGQVLEMKNWQGPASAATGA
jgi:hypothetical protein